MLISKKTKLIDIINYNYRILPVFNRFAIYTGFGDKTVIQVCEEKNINLNLFLNIINAFLDKNYKPLINYEDYNINEIITYLKQAHQDYLVELKKIEKLLIQVIENCCVKKQKEVHLINDFFISYKKDLIEHINFEDKEFFPYCLNLENKYNKNIFEINTFIDLDYYKNEHLNIENKIIDLKSILVKYLPIDKPTEFLNNLIFEIYDFENDLFNHQSIEEKLLLNKIEFILKKFKINKK